MSGAPRLSLDGVSFSYEGGTGRALTDISVDLPLGAVVAVLGRQACGKTTLLRAVAGSLGAIYSGELGGRVVLRDDPPGTERPLGGGDVSSFFDSYVQVTLSADSVREEIGLPLLAQGISESERDRIAIAAARELRIEHLLERPTTGLSGGEEKLVGLAAAIGAPAPVYLLDEPFEQLDVDHLRAVIKAIRVRSRRGSLVLVATGALDIALNVADAALVSRGDTWHLDRSPSYALLADAAANLGSTQVLAFLEGGAHPEEPLAEIRSYRDAVRRRAAR